VALLETSLAGLPRRTGKVRDVYDLGDGRLLFIATDRISAFDWVLPTGIPDKGRVLTGLSAFWFERTRPWKNHLLSTSIDDAGLDLAPAVRDSLAGRSMIVRKAEVIPFECVVRGYLSGSGWRDYCDTGSVCGVTLPAGLLQSGRLPARDDPDMPGAEFTPATKARSGHDENVSFARLIAALGETRAEMLRRASIDVYLKAAAYAESKGLILADTKLEWGWEPATGDMLLVDELLTPDSARYWPRAEYRPGGPQPSFDKQFVRDWLEQTGWDKASPPPPLPADVVARTRDKYIDAYEILTGQPFPWK
jgi:phosphoribosylaminoimidazole-succinocarboxamide synthase